MRLMNAMRSCAVAVFCLSAFSPAAHSEQHAISLTHTNFQLLASPFATPAGAPLALSNLMNVATGSFDLFTWNTTNQQFHPIAVNRTGTWIGGSTTVARGQGFWIRKKFSNDFNVVFTGSLATALAVTNRLSHEFPGSFHLVGYPYLSSVALTNLNLTNDIRPYVTGTMLYVWNPAGTNYRTFFYDADGGLGGGWQDADDPGQPTDYVLQPMEGFWIRLTGQTSLVWRALAP